MPRSHLDREIADLKKKLLNLTAIVEKSVADAVKAVTSFDIEIAESVKSKDNEIDDMEVSLEEDCLKILALYQPVATDLRFIIAALKINNDLERIGDLAGNIANRSIKLSASKDKKSPFDVLPMTQKVQEMLRNSLNSLVELNLDMAKQVITDDQVIDDIYRKTYSSVSSAIKKNPEDTKVMISYLSVARHLERIADLATNIAEDVIYLIEGSIVRHVRWEEVE